MQNYLINLGDIEDLRLKLYALKEKMKESKIFMLQKNLASANLSILEKEIENRNIMCEKLLITLQNETEEKEELEREMNIILENNKQSETKQESIEQIGQLEAEFSEMKLIKENLKKEFNEHEEALEFVNKKNEEIDALKKEITFRKNVIFKINKQLIEENEKFIKVENEDKDFEIKCGKFFSYCKP